MDHERSESCAKSHIFSPVSAIFTWYVEFLITKHAVSSCDSKSSALVVGLSQINQITLHVFVQLSIQNALDHKLVNEFGKLIHVNAEFAKAWLQISVKPVHNVNVCKCALFPNAYESIVVTLFHKTNHDSWLFANA